MENQRTGVERLIELTGKRGKDRHSPGGGVSLGDFYAYMPMHSYSTRRRATCGRPPASMPACRPSH